MQMSDFLIRMYMQNILYNNHIEIKTNVILPKCCGVKDLTT